MGFLSPKMPSLPPPPPPIPVPPPELSAEEQKRIRDEMAARERKRRGRSSTIITGSSGLTEEANTEKKSLLGM
jgi:hypothetical protein